MEEWKYPSCNSVNRKSDTPKRETKYWVQKERKNFGNQKGGYGKITTAWKGEKQC
jgi:hypothetical protein